MDDNKRDIDIDIDRNETFQREQILKESGRGDEIGDEEFSTEIVNPAPVANTAMTGRIDRDEDFIAVEYDDNEEFGQEVAEPLPTVTYDRKPFRSEERKEDNGMMEMASEVAHAVPKAADRAMDKVSNVFTTENARGAAPARGRTLGWIGLILAVASLFIMPAILGPAAAVIGFVAYVRGSRALGVWAVALGLLALLAFLFLVPYYS